MTKYILNTRTADGRILRKRTEIETDDPAEYLRGYAKKSLALCKKHKNLDLFRGWEFSLLDPENDQTKYSVYIPLKGTKIEVK